MGFIYSTSQEKLLFRSTDTLGGEVKFDIWEEADLEMEEGGLEHLEGEGGHSGQR